MQVRALAGTSTNTGSEFRLTVQRVLETADLLFCGCRRGLDARRFGLCNGGFQLGYARAAQLDCQLRSECTGPAPVGTR